MPALSRCRASLVVVIVGMSAVACKPKVTPAECDLLVERYARLVVTEKYPDASSERISEEAKRELGEARGDDAFKNCRSEVSRSEFDCAMLAPSADALEKCLE